MVGIGKSAEVGPDFGGDDESGIDADHRDGGEVDAEQAQNRALHGPLVIRRRGFSERLVLIVVDGQSQKDVLYALMALFDLLVKEVVSLECLLQSEEVFVAPVSIEATRDGDFVGFNAAVTKGSEDIAIALTVDDGAQDSQTGFTDDIAEDVVELNIHLGQGLLDLLYATCGITREAGLLSDVGAQDTGFVGRSEGASEKAIGHQLPDPLAVEHIAFATADLFGRPRVDEMDIEALAVEDFIERDPVDTGRFHGHGVDAAFAEPLCDGFEFIGEGAEVSDRLVIRFRVDGDVVSGLSDIDAGAVRINDLQLAGYALARHLDFSHYLHEVVLGEIAVGIHSFIRGHAKACHQRGQAERNPGHANKRVRAHHWRNGLAPSTAYLYRRA